MFSKSFKIFRNNFADLMFDIKHMCCLHSEVVLILFSCVMLLSCLSANANTSTAKDKPEMDLLVAPLSLSSNILS